MEARPRGGGADSAPPPLKPAAGRPPLLLSLHLYQFRDSLWRAHGQPTAFLALRQVNTRLSRAGGAMSAPSDLLIVSAKAARRLRLLQLPQLGGGAAAAAAAAATTAADGSLPVALLAEPVPVSANGGSSWQQERDVLLEVAVTLPTLHALKVGTAALHTPVD